MEFVEDAAIGLYVNTFSLMMLLALVSLSYRLVHARTGEDKLFLYMCAAVGGYALSGIIYFGAMGLHNVFSRPLMTLGVTCGRVTALLLLFLWILYVDYKLNRSKDHLFRRYPGLLVPVAGVLLIVVINLFTGIAFYVDSSLALHFKPLSYVIFYVNQALFIFAGIVFFKYKKRAGSAQFFSIAPFLIPVVAGASGEAIGIFAPETAGFTLGLIFLYFSMIACWRFEDDDPYFYNTEYFEYVHEQYLAGKHPVKGAVLFLGNDKALAGLLKRLLPKENETVRLSEGRFVFLSPIADENRLQSLAMLVEDEAEQYDKENPDDTIDFDVAYYYPPMGDEAAADWLFEIGK